MKKSVFFCVFFQLGGGGFRPQLKIPIIFLSLIFEAFPYFVAITIIKRQLNLYDVNIKLDLSFK